MIFDNKTIRVAVKKWLDSPEEAESIFGHISYWDVSNVTDMNDLFSVTEFNSDISQWDVSNVTDMSYMFNCTWYFNQDLSNWDVSNVTNMRGMFRVALCFNSNIGRWNVGNVTNMNKMFSGGGFLGNSSFNQDISNWDVSNVVDMGYMFNDAKEFNQYIGGWDVRNVTNMRGMFSGAVSFNQDISNWKLNKEVVLSDMFLRAKAFNQNLINWGADYKMIQELSLKNYKHEIKEDFSIRKKFISTKEFIFDIKKYVDSNNKDISIKVSVLNNGIHKEEKYADWREGKKYSLVFKISPCKRNNGICEWYSYSGDLKTLLKQLEGKSVSDLSNKNFNLDLESFSPGNLNDLRNIEIFESDIKITQKSKVAKSGMQDYYQIYDNYLSNLYIDEDKSEIIFDEGSVIAITIRVEYNIYTLTSIEDFKNFNANGCYIGKISFNELDSLMPDY
jgi:surface protein